MKYHTTKRHQIYIRCFMGFETQIMRKLKA